VKLADLAAAMRAQGVSELAFGSSGCEGLVLDGTELAPVTHIKLEPAGAVGSSSPGLTETEPAGFEPEPEEQKPPGSCAHPGCMGKAGFHFAPMLCDKHGLAEFGVHP
jgi:hypothetical protein